MAAKSRLLGDGRGHGLDGGSAMVATPTPRQGQHAFDAAGLCQCGVRRKVSGDLILYLGDGGWTQTRPRCSAVWQ